MEENWKYFETATPTFTNINLQFTGIGNLVIHGNGLLSALLRKYNLNVRNLPLHTIKHGLFFLLSNLKTSGFSVIDIFFEEEEDGYRDFAIKYIKSLYSCREITHFNDYMKNERIALMMGDSSKRSLSFLFQCLSRNLYVALLDNIDFRIPSVYSFVYTPLPIRNDSSIVFGLDGKEERMSENGVYLESIGDIDLKKIEDEFLNGMDDFFYSTSEKDIPLSLCKSFNFDGRIILSEKIMLDGEPLEPCSLSTIFGTRKDKEYIPENLELDLLVNWKQTTSSSSSIHLRNIQKSAMSLFDGKLLFSPIVRSEEKKTKKISKKQQLIIKESEERIRKQKMAKDNIWLKNFYNNYKKSEKEDRKIMLEQVVTDNKNIHRRILLLKIEFYADVWNLEKLSDTCDERVIVPCYLNCLEYLEKYRSDGNLNELKFVLQSLIDCGFEATVHEIIEEYNIDVDLEFYTEDTSAPSDYDICFQLKHTGDKLKRSLGSRKDERVLFEPDDWQIKLLDLVDQHKSAVGGAPTSSGKTFICFYAIEKILRESDSDMVIFCLPTKALANQVSADIYARFAPKFNVKMNIQGSLMKDYSNDPFNCQVLITIPCLLESILNSPPPKMLNRIKYIIIDEVHKISSEEMGPAIERIFHLSPCPLLVLSATLGNLEGFYGWMKRIEDSKGRVCELVVHNERYCELKPFVYSSRGIVPVSSLFAYSYEHIKKFGFGNDYNFLPEELLHLFDSLCSVLTEPQKELLDPLIPENYFKSNILKKKDCKEYEKHLLDQFQSLIKNNKLTPKQVKKLYNLQIKDAVRAFEDVKAFDDKYILDNMIGLLNSLKEKDMLPCIVFNTDRDFVNRLAVGVYEELERQDKEVKRNKVLDKLKKEAKRSRDTEKGKDSWIEESMMAERNFELKVDRKNIMYSFLDPVTKITDYELDEETRHIRNTKPEFVDMMYRGIGVHHEQMNRRYRSVAEVLFRQKHLRVLFATDTLALGINMPCRSVVFAGDRLLLDPLNYKQMAGRAGRRGYDTLGNVVFMGIPEKRVQNLMVSLLPNIKGMYTYTNSSFVGFGIKESLIKYPLLYGVDVDSSLDELVGKISLGEEDSVKENISTIEKYNNKYDYDLRSLFMNVEERRRLVDYQLSIIAEHFNEHSYLIDLVMSNRDSDPSIFVFVLLVEMKLVNYEPLEFMNLLSHLFEVRPVLFKNKNVLPPLDRKVYEICKDVNELSKECSLLLYKGVLRGLQRMSNEPNHNVLSFVRVNYLDAEKNSYLLDFFRHGNVKRICAENKIRSADLFKSLSVVNGVLTSLSRWFSKYDVDSDALKRISNSCCLFESKFKAIFA